MLGFYLDKKGLKMNKIISLIAIGLVGFLAGMLFKNRRVDSQISNLDEKLQSLGLKVSVIERCHDNDLKSLRIR